MIVWGEVCPSARFSNMVKAWNWKRQKIEIDQDIDKIEDEILILRYLNRVRHRVQQ